MAAPELELRSIHEVRYARKSGILRGRQIEELQWGRGSGGDGKLVVKLGMVGRSGWALRVWGN